MPMRFIRIPQLMVFLFLLCKVSDLPAQSLVPDDYQLKIGDIIQFEGFQNKRHYGLVDRMNSAFFNVKYYQRGIWASRGITRNVRWQVYLMSKDIDRADKPMSVFRKWRSKNGKSTTMARLMDVDGENAVLRKKNGKSVSVPLKKLSSKDQRFAKSLHARRAKKLDLSKLPEEAVRVVEYRNKKMNKGSSKKIASRNVKSIDFSSSKWTPFKFESNNGDQNDGLASSLEIESENITPGGKLTNVNLAAGNSLAFCLIEPGKMRDTKTNLLLSVVDLKERKEIGNISLGTKVFGERVGLGSVSPSGSVFVTYRNQRMEASWTFYRIREGRIEKMFEQNGIDKTIHPKFYLTSDSSGFALTNRRLQFFKLKDKSVELTNQSGNGVGMTIARVDCSPDGSLCYAYHMSDNQVIVVDTKSKKMVGKIQAKEPLGLFKIHTMPEKNQFQIDQQKSLNTYSLNDGSLIGSVKKTQLSIGTSFEVGRFGMISGSKLFNKKVDIQVGSISRNKNFGAKTIELGFGKRIDVSIKSEQPASGFGRGSGFDDENEVDQEIKNRMRESRFDGGGRSRKKREEDDQKSQKKSAGSIVFEKLELPVEQLALDIDSIKESDVVNFTKGSTVQITAHINPERGSKAAILRSVTSTLQRAGIKVVQDDAEFRLELRYSEGKPQTRKYNVIGGIRGMTQRTETIVPKSVSARLVSSEGDVIWGTGNSGNLNNVGGSEESLNRQKGAASSISVQDLTGYKYPSHIRKIKRSKRIRIGWEKK